LVEELGHKLEHQQLEQCKQVEELGHQQQLVQCKLVEVLEHKLEHQQLEQCKLVEVLGHKLEHQLEQCKLVEVLEHQQQLVQCKLVEVLEHKLEHQQLVQHKLVEVLVECKLVGKQVERFLCRFLRRRSQLWSILRLRMQHSLHSQLQLGDSFLHILEQIGFCNQGLQQSEVHICEGIVRNNRIFLVHKQVGVLELLQCIVLER